jgi:hypothetical protein
MKKNKSKEVTNVEFGMEFGDLNSGKFYELAAFSNQKENKGSQKDKRKK